MKTQTLDVLKQQVAQRRFQVRQLERNYTRALNQARRAQAEGVRTLIANSAATDPRQAGMIFSALAHCARTRRDLPASWTRLAPAKKQALAPFVAVIESHQEISRWSTTKENFDGFCAERKIGPKETDPLLDIARKRRDNLTGFRNQVRALRENLAPELLNTFFEVFARLQKGQPVPVGEERQIYEYVLFWLQPVFGETLKLLQTPENEIRKAELTGAWSTQRQQLIEKNLQVFSLALEQGSRPTSWKKDKDPVKDDVKGFLLLLGSFLRTGKHADTAAQAKFEKYCSDLKQEAKTLADSLQALLREIATLRITISTPPRLRGLQWLRDRKLRDLKLGLEFVLDLSSPSLDRVLDAEFLAKAPAELGCLATATAESAKRKEEALEKGCAAHKPTKTVPQPAALFIELAEREEGLPAAFTKLEGEKAAAAVAVARIQTGITEAQTNREGAKTELTQTITRGPIEVHARVDEALVTLETKAKETWREDSLPQLWRTVATSPRNFLLQQAVQNVGRRIPQRAVAEWAQVQNREGHLVGALEAQAEGLREIFLRHAPRLFRDYPPPRIQLIGPGDPAYIAQEQEGYSATQAKAELAQEFLPPGFRQTVYEEMCLLRNEEADMGHHYLTDEQVGLFRKHFDLSRMPLERRQMEIRLQQTKEPSIEWRTRFPAVFHVGLQIPHPHWARTWLGGNVLFTNVGRHFSAPYPSPAIGTGHPARISTLPEEIGIFAYDTMAGLGLAAQAILGLEVSGFSQTSLFQKANKMAQTICQSEMYFSLDGLPPALATELLAVARFAAQVSRMEFQKLWIAEHDGHRAAILDYHTGARKLTVAGTNF